MQIMMFTNALSGHLPQSGLILQLLFVTEKRFIV